MMVARRPNASDEAAQVRERLMRLWKVSRRELGLGYGNKRYFPTIQNLARFGSAVHLDTGGTLRAFGIDPNVIRDSTWRWQPERTRPVSSYEFHRGSAIDLPLTFAGDASIWSRNAFLTELVTQVQTVPRRALASELWCKRGSFYGRLGLGDYSCLPLLPPGASLLIDRLLPEERANPDPEALYFLKLPYGYGCGHCCVLPGELEVREPGGTGRSARFRYLGPAPNLQAIAAEPTATGRARLCAERKLRSHENRARILGRVAAIFVDFEVPWSEEVRPGDDQTDVPATLISETESLSELVEIERRRWRWSQRQLDTFGEEISAATGFAVGGRRIQGIARNETPHLGTAIALSILYCHRLEDVLAKCGLLFPDSTRYDLETLLAAENLESLPSLIELNSHIGSLPQPSNRHNQLLDEWGEWPAVLPSLGPYLSARNSRKVLRLNQSSVYKGLDPLIPPGAFFVVETQLRGRDVLSADEAELPGWKRPIYVFETRRYGRICSHAARAGNDGTITLVPYEGSGEAPQRLKPQDIDLTGVVVGVALRV